MPRILNPVYQTRYKTEDFTKWIRGRMAVEGKTQAIMAKRLSVTQQGYGMKMIRNAYSFSDFLNIVDELQATDEEIVDIVRGRIGRRGK